MRLLLTSPAFNFANPRCDSSSPPPPNTLCKSALYTLLSSHTPLLSVPRTGLLALGLGACYSFAGNPLCPAPQEDSSILP